MSKVFRIFLLIAILLPLAASAALLDNCAVVRLKDNGGVDPSFGKGGVTLLPLGAYSRVSRILAGPNKDFLVFGENQLGANINEANVTKLSPGGKTDPRFGAGTGVHPGISYTRFGQGGSLAAADAVLDDAARSGKIAFVLLGRYGVILPEENRIRTNTLNLGRFFYADAGADPSFGKEGYVFQNTGLESFDPVAIKARPGGGFLVAGSGRESDGGNVLLVYAFLPNGQRDESFGKDGCASSPVPSLFSYGQATGLGIDLTGTIFVCGTYHTTDRTSRIVVASFTAEGRVNPAFNAGKTPGFLAIMDWRLTRVSADALSVVYRRTAGNRPLPALRGRRAAPNPGGLGEEIVLAGVRDQNFSGPGVMDALIIKLTPDGKFISSFGEGGFRAVPATAMDAGSPRLVLHALDTDSKGRFILAGCLRPKNDVFSGRAFVARFDKEMSFDESFARKGIALVSADPSLKFQSVTAMAGQEDGSLLVGLSFY